MNTYDLIDQLRQDPQDPGRSALEAARAELVAGYERWVDHHRQQGPGRLTRPHPLVLYSRAIRSLDEAISARDKAQQTERYW